MRPSGRGRIGLAWGERGAGGWADCRPFGAPLGGVRRARDRGVAPAGQKSRVGGWRGACVGVAGTQAGPGLPLALGKGMASMSEPAGRVAQPPGPDQCRRAVPLRGTAHMKPCQPPTRLRPAPPPAKALKRSKTQHLNTKAAATSPALAQASPRRSGRAQRLVLPHHAARRPRRRPAGPAPLAPANL